MVRALIIVREDVASTALQLSASQRYDQRCKGYTIIKRYCCMDNMCITRIDSLLGFLAVLNNYISL